MSAALRECGAGAYTVNSSSHSGVAVLRNVSVRNAASFCPSMTTSQNGLVRDTERGGEREERGGEEGERDAGRGGRMGDSGGGEKGKGGERGGSRMGDSGGGKDETETREKGEGREREKGEGERAK